MSKATTVECPSWCIQPHTETNWTRGGFHHDGLDVTLDFDSESHTDNVARSWHVKASQYVSDDNARTVSPPRVEIQDDGHVIAVLTPRDALELAVMLADTATLADPVAATEWQDRRAATSVGRSLDEARDQWPGLFL